MHEIQIKNLWYGIKKTEEKRQMKIKKGVSQRKTLWDQKAKQIDEKSNNKCLKKKRFWKFPDDILTLRRYSLEISVVTSSIQIARLFSKA